MNREGGKEGEEKKTVKFELSINNKVEEGRKGKEVSHIYAHVTFHKSVSENKS